MRIYYFVLLFGLLGGLAECFQHPDVLTLKERIALFGTESSLNLPPVDFVSLKRFDVDHIRPFRKRPINIVQYHLTLNNESITLTLRPNAELVSPGCVVHRYKRNGRKSIYPCAEYRSHCFYTGNSENHNDSWVAADICNGLRGVITISNTSLFISPLRRKLLPSSSNESDVHAVYRFQGNKRVCGTKEQLLAYKHPRLKRSADQKYIEARVVIDQSMYNFHKQDAEDYMQTLLNVASKLFKEKSIDDVIRLVVTEIHIFEEYDHFGSEKNTSAKDILHSFCAWQAQHDSALAESDCSLLITRKSMVYKGSNTATGLANTGAMCKKQTKCAIVQDFGPASGFTVAHEIGHLLGMNHDGEGNTCQGIMLPYGASGETAYTWSHCSTNDMKTFFRDKHPACLFNEPNGLKNKMRNDAHIPLPGTLYSIDDQCKMLMGPNASYCGTPDILSTNNIPDKCSNNICKQMDNASCFIQTPPLLDGTDVNNTHTWCIRGKSAAMDNTTAEHVAPIDGAWSDWDASFSKCSRTCGGGVKIKRRKCNNPLPQFSGKQCEGPYIKAVLCNVKTCSSDYKDQQCANYNTKYDSYHAYDPNTFTGDESCIKRCESSIVSSRQSILNTIGRPYADGTDCRLDEIVPFSRCIDGKCRIFGCDGHMDSVFRYDQCGVCNGTGNTCRRVSGTYNKDDVAKRFTAVQTIPKGSSNVVIIQTNLYCFLSMVIDGTRIINKYKTQDRSQTFFPNEMQIKYTNPPKAPEEIEITGPTTQNIEVQVFRNYDYTLFTGVTPYINISYYVPSTDVPSRYAWSIASTQCTEPCGTGTATPIVQCRSLSAEIVDDHFCDIAQKPDETQKPCNVHLCAPKWATSDWQPCSVTCGIGIKQRGVHCVQINKGQYLDVPDDLCAATTHPHRNATCNSGQCPGIWKTGPWSNCSATCGEGIMTRNVKCFENANSTQSTEDGYCDKNKPDTSTTCPGGPCNKYFVGENCTNKEPTCKENYGADICVGTYKNWAAFNCMKECGICASNLCLDEPRCKQVIKAPGMCHTYQFWMRKHCPRQCEYCGKCAKTCDNLPDGNYQSCIGCDVYATCTNGSFVDNRPCPAYHVWDDIMKTCALSSITCIDCHDTTDCSRYDLKYCHGEYAAFMMSHCHKYCNFC